MGGMQRLCSRRYYVENGKVKYMGSISDTIRTYQSDEIIQNSFEGTDGNKQILYLKETSVSSSDGNIFYNSSTIKIEFEICVKHIPSLIYWI